ncbi:MAG: FtsX-like permease family protein [Fuerstiella sp.]|jgi:putative ABC transport system permease protein|nr:FtsX-like permease family protein [Fuerstiella sp.]MDG2128821.1 ABC transporter permease [Fuerstiella sp.]
MDFLLTVSVAIRALGRNKMRAGLTVLGVVIGIAAVTTMVSIGSSAGQLVQNELQSFGTNFLFVSGKSERRNGVRQQSTPSLTESDAEAVSAELDSVLAVSPLVGTSKPVVRGNNNCQPNEMFGVGEQYLLIRAWKLQAGSFFSERDIQSGNRVCVIGHTIVRELFQTANPLGETIRVGNIPFTVVGILEKKGAGLTGQDQDNVLLLPFTTVKKRLHGSNFDDVHAIFVAAKSPGEVQTATREIELLLRDRHGIAPGAAADFEVHSSDEISKFMGTVTGIMTALLASIAGISLLVGGVGIMNIMLVSVTERTREIGIRMAVGARGRDILVQFLIESVVLSCFGGAIGMTLGVSASMGITAIINELSPGSDWPVIVSIPAAIVAMIFAAVVGMIFGLYPAWRASRLDPIDALRYE